MSPHPRRNGIRGKDYAMQGVDVQVSRAAGTLDHCRWVMAAAPSAAEHH